MVVLMTVISKEVPAEDIANMDRESALKHPLFKAQKWSSRALVKMFYGYGLPGSVDTDYENFAEYWIENHGFKGLEVMMEVLQRKKQGALLHPITERNAFVYLKHAYVFYTYLIRLCFCLSPLLFCVVS